MERIRSLPDRVARTVLVALCNDPLILARATEFAELLPDAGWKNDADADGAVRIGSDAASEYDSASTRKRKAPSQELRCERCELAFSDDDNYKGACKYHDGELEPDYDSGFWEDHDESLHGPIDTEHNRTEFPEGFFWTCCGKKGHVLLGCQEGWHRNSSAASKRSRLADDEDDEVDNTLPPMNGRRAEYTDYEGQEEPIPEPYDSFGGEGEDDEDADGSDGVEEVGPVHVADGEDSEEEDDEGHADFDDTLLARRGSINSPLAVEDDDENDAGLDVDGGDEEDGYTFERHEVIEPDGEEGGAPLVSIIDDEDAPGEVRHEFAYEIADDDDDDEDVAEDVNGTVSDGLEAAVVGGDRVNEPESVTVADDDNDGDDVDDDRFAAVGGLE